LLALNEHRARLSPACKAKVIAYDEKQEKNNSGNDLRVFAAPPMQKLLNRSVMSTRTASPSAVVGPSRRGMIGLLSVLYFKFGSIESFE
jgi:hypothetical protein